MSREAVTYLLRADKCALATLMPVAIEVPVMLLVVKVVNASKGWHESGSRA